MHIDFGFHNVFPILYCQLKFTRHLLLVVVALRLLVLLHVFLPLAGHLAVLELVVLVLLALLLQVIVEVLPLSFVLGFDHLPYQPFVLLKQITLIRIILRVTVEQLEVLLMLALVELVKVQQTRVSTSAFWLDLMFNIVEGLLPCQWMKQPQSISQQVPHSVASIQTSILKIKATLKHKNKYLVVKINEKCICSF